MIQSASAAGISLVSTETEVQAALVGVLGALDTAHLAINTPAKRSIITGGLQDLR